MTATSAASERASSEPAEEATPGPTRRSFLKRVAELALFGMLPAFLVLTLFAAAVETDSIGIDFRQMYRAAEVVLDGESPYVVTDEPLTEWGGPYPYPPLPALLAIPLTPLPLDVAGALLMAVLVLVALAIPYVLGVRDWRCYGMLLLWPPVISAIQTANVTLWFALALALTWRFRDRLAPVALAVGATLAVKFFLWPALAWMAATRRVAAAALSCVVGVLLLLISWLPLGFAGLADYPSLLRKLEETVGDDSYTLFIVGLDAGLPSPVARVLWLGAGFLLLASVIIVARRGDERTAFILAIAAALALTPIVWLHYFALLTVVVALAQPRLGALWLVPLGLVITPGSGSPTPFETAASLSVVALTFALAVRAAREHTVEPRPRTADVVV